MKVKEQIESMQKSIEILDDVVTGLCKWHNDTIKEQKKEVEQNDVLTVKNKTLAENLEAINDKGIQKGDTFYVVIGNSYSYIPKIYECVCRDVNIESEVVKINREWFKNEGISFGGGIPYSFEISRCFKNSKEAEYDYKKSITVCGLEIKKNEQ